MTQIIKQFKSKRDQKEKPSIDYKFFLYAIWFLENGETQSLRINRQIIEELWVMMC